jgi:hypothetical protein
LKYTKEIYEKMQQDCPIWGFPTEDEQCYGAKMVKIRSAKECCGSNHRYDGDHTGTFPSGTLMLREKCLFDGGWRQSYTCTECLDNWIDGLLDHCGRI